MTLSKGFIELRAGRTRPCASATHKAIHSTEEPVRHKVDTLIDVWCEAPVDARWEEVANSAVEQEQRDVLWGGVDYWFVMGTFHSRRLYDAFGLTAEHQACTRASVFQIIIPPF